MVDVTTDGGAAVVTLNRPQARNALDTRDDRGPDRRADGRSTPTTASTP